MMSSAHARGPGSLFEYDFMDVESGAARPLDEGDTDSAQHPVSGYSSCHLRVPHICTTGHVLVLPSEIILVGETVSALEDRGTWMGVDSTDTEGALNREGPATSDVAGYIAVEALLLVQFMRRPVGVDGRGVAGARFTK